MRTKDILRKRRTILKNMTHRSGLGQFYHIQVLRSLKKRTDKQLAAGVNRLQAIKKTLRQTSVDLTRIIDYIDQDRLFFGFVLFFKEN